MGISYFFTGFSWIGLLLAIVIGAIWLAPFVPYRLKRWSTWAVFAGGVIAFIPAILYIQSPLQSLTGNAILSAMGQDAYVANLLWAGIPVVLISGLVQEAAKLFPTAIYRIYHKDDFNPKLGLTLGALAGAGFGIIEAQWVLNMIISQGWTPELANVIGITAYAGFWERFFAVCFHISIGAAAGWGLGRGWGWQFYLVAGIAHGFLNYSAVLVQTGVFNTIMAEIFIALCAIIAFMPVMWLRWKKE